MHMRDPEQRPDTEFELGTLSHLVVGNAGRLLDSRRTPVRIVALHPQRGSWELEILAFEDAGGRWDLPYEQVSSFQFALGAARVHESALADIHAAVAAGQQRLVVEASPAAQEKTEAGITAARTACAQWLDQHGTFDPEALDLTSRTGHPALYEDLRGWLTTLGLAEMDTAFAARFVSNPGSGELVKGHRIVLAEAGLCAFEGRVIRDEDLFAGAWSRAERVRHVVARMAFVREVLERAGHSELVLWRGMATDRLRPMTNRTFLSTTPSKEVAEAFCIGRRTAVLTRHTVDVRRVFMTYLETRAMNQHFQETEVVLLFAAGEPL